MTVNIIDRFLSNQGVVRKTLQLVGLVAMLLACKYEEVSVPIVDDLIFISDKAYTRTDVLEMVAIFSNLRIFTYCISNCFSFVILFKLFIFSHTLLQERLILKTLQFNLSVPTPYVFMKRFLKAAQSDRKVCIDVFHEESTSLESFSLKSDSQGFSLRLVQLELLSFYLIELCLVEYEMLKFPPSFLAAAVVYTAQCSLYGIKQWTKTCEWHTSYYEDQLL